MPVQPQPPTYQTCAVMGGAQLANGNLGNLDKAQFAFKPANCSYSSESCAWLRTAILAISVLSPVRCEIKAGAQAAEVWVASVACSHSICSWRTGCLLPGCSGHVDSQTE